MIDDIEGGVPTYGAKKPMVKKLRARKPKPVRPCLYNDGVVCDDFKCGRCGFNPEGRKRNVRVD